MRLSQELTAITTDLLSNREGSAAVSGDRTVHQSRCKTAHARTFGVCATALQRPKEILIANLAIRSGDGVAIVVSSTCWAKVGSSPLLRNQSLQWSVQLVWAARRVGCVGRDQTCSKAVGNAKHDDNDGKVTHYEQVRRALNYCNYLTVARKYRCAGFHPKLLHSGQADVRGPPSRVVSTVVAALPHALVGT